MTCQQTQKHSSRTIKGGDEFGDVIRGDKYEEGQRPNIACVCFVIPNT